MTEPEDDIESENAEPQRKQPAPVFVYDGDEPFDGDAPIDDGEETSE